MAKIDEQTLSDANLFVAVVRGGSVIRGARSMNLSQSVASRALARLEKRVGVRVLDRTTRSMALTDEGRTLYERLEPLLGQFEEAFAQVAEEQRKVRGRLRVKLHPTLSHVIPGKQLRAFLDRYPELSVEMINDDRLGDLVGDGIDLALTVGELPPSSLIAKRLVDTRVITVASPTYLATHAKILHPNDLVNGDHVLIDYRDPETGRPFQWEHRRGRKTVKIPTPSRLIVSDIVSLHNICVAGWGIAQVLDIAVKPLLTSGSIVELLPEWNDERFPIFAVYSSRSYAPPRRRVFLDFIESVLRKAS